MCRNLPISFSSGMAGAEKTRYLSVTKQNMSKRAFNKLQVVGEMVDEKGTNVMNHPHPDC